MPREIDQPTSGTGGGAALWHFFVRAASILFIVTPLWWLVADFVTLPAAWLTKVVTTQVFSDLISDGHVSVGRVELDTNMRVNLAALPGAQALPRGAEATLVVEVKSSRYGYGLPLLLALLVSGSRRRLARHAVLGAICLVPLHAFSLVMVLVKEAALTGGPTILAQTGWASWQVELAAYGYQLGVLLVPTLSPILLWLWLDRPFMMGLLLEGWLRNVRMK